MMKTHKLLLLAIACTWAMGAAAQWQWIDKDGRKVFSDRPPPQEIPDKSILKQPSGGRAAVAAPVAPPADGAPSAAADTAASAPAPRATASAAASGKDKALEEKKAQTEAAEAAKKKAEEDKVAKTKADNCNRARLAKAAFETGRPITQPNAQGERIFLDEAGRAAETKRLDSIIASDCKR